MRVPFPAVVSRLRDHVVLAINQRTSHVFGVAHEDAIGKHAPDYYVNPEERRMLAEEVHRHGRAENLRFQLKRPTGDTFWASVSSRRVEFGGEPAILTVFSDITEQVEAERVLKASEERLVSQSNALTELTARHADASGGFDDRLRGILHASARTLKVERIGLWRMAPGHGSIHCVSLHRLTPGVDESGAVLQRDDAPSYFAALEHERVIAAPDAQTDPRTHEFMQPYLRPHGIGAMLDVPIRQDDRIIGVLCAEHVGGVRTWTVDEQNFAVSTANLIAVAMADDERRVALARLADSEARARLIVDTAPDAFIGIDTVGPDRHLEHAGGSHLRVDARRGDRTRHGRAR